MLKISKIVPANARTSSAEVDNSSHPLRPGVPSFGQRVGRTSSERAKALEATKLLSSMERAGVQDKVSLSSSSSSQAPASQKFNQDGTYKLSPEAKRSRIVEDMSKSFFVDNVRVRNAAKAQEALKIQALEAAQAAELESEENPLSLVDDGVATSEERFEAALVR